MGLSDGMGLSAADVAAVTGNNNGFGFGGDGAWWLLILFLFAFGGGNWGNGYGGYGGTGAEVQRGFDQSAVISGISGNYYDAWDSGNEIPVNVYTMETLYE